MEARERYLEGQAIQEARQAGIKEVVEWIQQNQILEGETLPEITGVHIVTDMGWQSKLKEWGIKEVK